MRLSPELLIAIGGAYIVMTAGVQIGTALIVKYLEARHDSKVSIPGGNGHIKWQDVTKHCAGQQALLVQAMETSMTKSVDPLLRELKRGDGQFQELGDKVDNLGERVTRVEEKMR